MEDFGLMTWNKWKSEVFFKECLFLCEQQNSWTKYRCFWQQLNALKGEQLIENPTCIVPSFRSMKELLKMSLLTSSGYIAVPEKVLYADWIISVVLFSFNWLSQLIAIIHWNRWQHSAAPAGEEAKPSWLWHLHVWPLHKWGLSNTQHDSCKYVWMCSTRGLSQW